MKGENQRLQAQLAQLGKDLDSLQKEILAKND